MNDPSTDHSAFQLNEEQVRFFNTFGYVVLKGLFSEDELRTIDREFHHAMEEQYADRPFDGSERHWTPMISEKTPFFSSLLEDPRFLNVAQQLYGEDVLGIVADANRYVGDTNWHRDTHTVLQYGVKFAYYLEPVGAETGALRVIPATHRLSDAADFREGVRPLPIGDVPARVLQSEPGDVVAFDLRLWHSSLGGSEDRRMCTVVYYANPKSPEESEVLRELGANMAKSTFGKFPCRDRFIFSSAWMDDTEGHPTRRKWIDRLRGIGFLDGEGMTEENRIP